MAAKQSILQRAREAAEAHQDGESVPKKVSSDWRDFFTKQQQIPIDSRKCTFNVFTAGDHGPVIFCLHGAGYTALTFSLIAEELSTDYRVVAMDQRHHGLTTEDLNAAEDLDFSKKTFSEDALAVWDAMFAEENPPTVLLGHSFGGAIAVWTATHCPMTGLQGLVVVDVVEGTAIASLPSMTGILNKRPESFDSPQAAITWVTEHSLSRCIRAASISVPSQLKQNGEGKWSWRTPLLQSEPFWSEWYLGLSDAFLKVPVPKVLIIAGADRLDRPLTIAQMQGKFQAVLVPNSGHAVHEDEADEVVSTVKNFVQRFRIGLPPLEIPRATPGLAPVLPQAIGPLFQNTER